MLLRAACAASAAGPSCAARRPLRCCVAQSEPPLAFLDEERRAPPPPGGPAPFLLAHELVRGPLAEWSDTSGANGRHKHPYTAVLLHGILGSRRNLASFAKRLAAAYPAWQFLLVDLRCHGASTLTDAPRPNTVAAAADDVLRLLNSLRLYPHALIGHSFGGKVAMGMVHAFGRQLPRPIQVWVLDTVPGDVFADGGDHPRDVIRFVGAMPLPIASRKALIDALTGAGFTPEGAAWMTTNLVATPKGLRWVFDLPGVAEMYTDYTDFNLWPLVEAPPLGARVDFVRAERSAFKWSAEDLERLERAGARVHLLENSSHWCHIDNPEGLMHILSTSLTEMQNGRSAG